MPPKKARAGAGAPPVPEHFTASELITRSSERYTPLRRVAIEINEELFQVRAGRTWRKSTLKPEEKYYLWCAQGGCCGNDGCKVSLDERSMTIEHLAPRSKCEEGIFDIRNMMVLCLRCNAKRGAKPARDVVGHDARLLSIAKTEYIQQGGFRDNRRRKK
jgi:hypothetical protein